jgi:hypothetical protein
MISDTLAEAHQEIRETLDHHEMGERMYGKRGTPLREWIESVAAQMNALREYLDAPPDAGDHGPGALHSLPSAPS